MKVISVDVDLKTGDRVTIRSAEPEEAEALLSHLRRLFRESYRNMNFHSTHFDQVRVVDQAKKVNDFNSSPFSALLIALKDGRVIANLAVMGGTGGFHKLNGRLAIGIEIDFTGKGLGKALIGVAVKQAKVMGLHRLELSVRTHNAAGIQLYEKSGFRRVGVLRDVAFFDEEFHDEFLYELILLG